MNPQEFEQLKSSLKTQNQGIPQADFSSLKKRLKEQQRQQSIQQQNANVKGGFLGKIFTSSTQKFGRSAGNTFAADKNIDLYNQAAKNFSDLQLKITKRMNENKATGKDNTRLQQALSQMQKPRMVDFVGEDTYRRMNETIGQNLKEIGGQTLGTVVEATGIGALKGVKGVGLVKNVAKTAEEARKAKIAFNTLSFGGKMKNIGLNTLKTVGATAPFGYAYDVASGLQGERGVNREGVKAFIPGAGTALSTAIPAGFGAIKAVRTGLGEVLPTVASNISGEPVEAYKRYQAGQLEGMIGKGANKADLLNDTRQAVSQYRKGMIEEFGQGIEGLSTKYAGNRVGLNEGETKVAKVIADSFGFELPQNVSNMSGKEASELITNLNESYIPNASTLADVAMNNKIKSLKNALMGKATQMFGGEQGDFANLYKNYAQKSKIYKDIAGVVGKVGERTPAQINAARNRLENIFKENNTGYLDAVKNFEKITGQRILDRVAAARLSPILPKTLRGGTGFNLMGFGADILSLITFPISSPRMGAWLIKQVSGLDTSAVTKLMNLSPKIRLAIFNAVNKENMSLDDAIKTYAKDIAATPNKQGGFADFTYGFGKEIRRTANGDIFPSENMKGLLKNSENLDDFVQKVERSVDAGRLTRKEIESVYDNFTGGLKGKGTIPENSKTITVYRGEGGSNGGGNYFTTNKEFANEFAGIKPLTKVKIPESSIYRPKILPEAVNESQVTKAIAEAKKRGFKAVFIDEGTPFGEPIESIYVFDKSILKK